MRSWELWVNFTNQSKSKDFTGDFHYVSVYVNVLPFYSKWETWHMYIHSNKSNVCLLYYEQLEKASKPRDSRTLPWISLEMWIMEDKKWGMYYAAHNSRPKTSNIWCVRAKTRQKILDAQSWIYMGILDKENNKWDCDCDERSIIPAVVLF